MKAPFPELPEVPEAQRATAEIMLRYEDICQDGRLLLAGMPYALGEVFWRSAAARSGIDDQLREQGIVPILSRLVVRGGQGPLSVSVPVQAEGRYQLAKVLDEEGAVERLMLNVWVKIQGPRGRTHGPAPDDEGELIDAGWVLAEHVFTRPFAAPAERKVLQLEHDGAPLVPATHHVWTAPQALLQLDEPMRPLDPELQLDAAPVVFGLDHCDSNQHVNSLVYPRHFVDVALRHLHDHGYSTPLLARYQETAFRKPCFAGQRLRWALRCFETAERCGAVGALIDHERAGALGDRPAHAYARVLFGK